MLIKNIKIEKNEDYPQESLPNDSVFARLKILVGIAVVPEGITFAQMSMVHNLIESLNKANEENLEELEISDEAFELMSNMLNSLKFTGYNPYVYFTLNYVLGLKQ